jgi:hypothetical protein
VCLVLEREKSKKNPRFFDASPKASQGRVEF